MNIPTLDDVIIKISKQLNASKVESFLKAHDLYFCHIIPYRINSFTTYLNFDYRKHYTNHESLIMYRSTYKKEMINAQICYDFFNSNVPLLFSKERKRY